jgi:hypothetical protein
MAVFSDLYLDYENRRDGHLLLWPVWIWTVHVPAPRRDGLNVLAYTVLALHASGHQDPDWISSWLGIDAELVRYIVGAELVPNGWLDQRRRITASGNQQLEGSASGDARQQAGFLFQSAGSGLLWPRFRGSLQEIEPLDRRERFPKFLASRDSGRTLSPFVVPPASVGPPVQPTVREIREVLRQDRMARHERRLRGGPRDMGDPSAGTIDFVDDKPRPAWLLCRVYRAPQSGQPWLVSDPLDHTPAAGWLRKEVYEASRRLPALAKRLKELLGEVDESLDWEAYRRCEDESIRFEVLMEFPEAGQIPGLEDMLIEFLRARSTVRAAKQARPEEIGSLLVQSQRVLERCCAWCLERWPLERPETRLSRQMTPRDLKQALGDAVSELSGKVIDDFNVQPSKVYGALKYGTGSLRQYLAGLLLSLTDHRDHPFRPLVSDESLMLRLVQLSKDRDVEGHGGGGPDNQRAKASQAIQHAETTVYVVRQLVEGIQDYGQEKQ